MDDASHPVRALMTRARLTERLRAHSQLSRSTVTLVVQTIITHMTDTLAGGERIELRGFGSFSLRYRAEQVRRNPRTGAPITVAGRYIAYFRAGKPLQERVNRRYREKETAAVKWDR